VPSPAPFESVTASVHAAGASDAAAASPHRNIGVDDHAHGDGGYGTADKVSGAVSCGHTDWRDQVPGRGYSLTTFRVTSCVHPTRKIAPGSEVHACLGRNVYVLWSSPRRGVPTTVDDFRAAGPSCIVLERGAGALRVASQDEGAAGSVLHTDRLLFVRGKERTSIFSDQDVSDVQLLLEAPSAGLCASWVTGGASLREQMRDKTAISRFSHGPTGVWTSPGRIAGS